MVEHSITVTETSGNHTADNDSAVSAAQPMDPTEVQKAVTQVVSFWKGVTVHQHRFGGVEFRVGRRELGHLHAFFADLPFPRVVRDELIATGRAKPHHVLPDSGWVTVPTRTSAQVAGVIELFRLNYERAMSRLPHAS